MARRRVRREAAVEAPGGGPSKGRPPAGVQEFTTLRLVSARRAFRSDAQMAEALGVDRAQLPRWRGGQTPDRENTERLAGLDLVVELLSGSLSATSIPKWLNGVNEHLGGRRPIALLRAGQLSEVIAAIEALKSGAYA